METSRVRLGWFKEYVNESHRLTVSSLETLFGTNEYRANVHGALSTLFDTLSASDASDDNVSKTAVVLFNHLIISSYRRFMTNGNRLQLDEKFEKCLVNKAFDIEALPTQRELLYTLTSGSSLIQIFRTMLTYIDADIQRLKSTATMTSNQCTQRYARETLCPICTTNASTNRIDESHDMNDPLCPNACRYVIKTCFNHSSNPYLALGSIAKGYSAVIKEIERATNELKVSRVAIAECERTRLSPFIACRATFQTAHLPVRYGCQRHEQSAHVHAAPDGLSTSERQAFQPHSFAATDHKRTARPRFELESIVTFHPQPTAIIHRYSHYKTFTADNY